jgi:pseudouridine-5'-phosphate glycosidase
MIRLTPEVDAALRDRAPIVALESSVLAQGLPIPANRQAAERMLSAVRAQGALPAITAVVRGEAALGITADELERFLKRDGVQKVSARDLAPAIVHQRDGATTVAATLAIMGKSDVRVFATGGIGGVHRAAPFDESADLLELSRTPSIVVCAGAKSILDLPATLERLETLGVPVVGYRTKEFPAFFTKSSGLPVSATAGSPDDVVAIERTHRALGRREAIVVVVPPPDEYALPADLVESAVSQSLAEAERNHVRGSAVTPYVLAAVERATGGRSLDANLALLESNAAVAGAIAVALARMYR